MFITAIAKRTLKDTAAKRLNGQNPYEEEYQVYDKNGRATGKIKTRKRPLPVGLSDNDAQVLKNVRKRAYRLDMALFNLCGLRFGWSSVIGIIPFIGDVFDCLLALMLVRSMATIDGGLPQLLQTRMMFNIALDFGIGLIPIIGDLADAFYRANTRNAWLLEVYLTKKAEADRRGQVPDPDNDDRPIPVKPQPARAKAGGIFGLGRAKRDDEEMAVPPTGTQVVEHLPGPSSGSRPAH